MTEDLVISVIHFLQPFYLLYLICICVTLLRCTFFNETTATKVALSFNVGDGIDRQVLHLDTQLLKATDMAITFMMFYLVPSWISSIVYFIVLRLCLRGALVMMTPRSESSKSKVE